LAIRWPLNKYGIVNGHVETIGSDTAEPTDASERDRKDTREHVTPRAAFRTLVTFDSPYVERDGKQFRVSAGKLVNAEVNRGSRTVMDYLLLPVQKDTREAGRKRSG
jgi:hemolysin D